MIAKSFIEPKYCDVFRSYPCSFSISKPYQACESSVCISMNTRSFDRNNTSVIFHSRLCFILISKGFCFHTFCL